MKIHADLSQRAVVNSEALPWVDSPMAGVQRRSEALRAWAAFFCP
jgi:hypothetical protein